jgi:beta-glucanase (GH16 family)
LSITVPIRSLLLCLIWFGSIASSHAQTHAIVPGGTARLTFSDDFHGPSLDRSKWNSNYTNSTRNLPGEEQIYTPDSFEIHDGVLHIKAAKRNVSNYKYTSGALTTFGSLEQTYGYFEIRARVPKGRGLWPALWMLPADRSWPPEIDIMEFLGRDVRNIWTTYHWLDSNLAHLKDGSGSIAQDWTSGFHVFALQWRPGFLAWYIDGKEVKTISGSHVPSSRMFLLMNLAIGGHWAGPPSAATPFPSSFEIDYVRAYQYEDLVETDDRSYRYLITHASDQTVKKGEEVRIDFGIENRSLTGAHRFQLVLKNAVSEVKVAQHDTQIMLDMRGVFRRSWNLKIPAEVASGLYVVSFGIFRTDWTRIDWLNNAKTILIYE